MNIWPERFQYITLTMNTENPSQTLPFIENKFSEIFPDLPLDYFFLDADFENQYRAEERIQRIFDVFTILGILISCLGVTGLAAFIAEQRTKEIGIRKTLGASVPGLLVILTKDFALWTLVGSLIAWPMAYLAMNQWLRGFAYRISPGWFAFVFAGVLYFIMAVFSAGLQVIRTARQNPIESLRYE